MMGNLKNFAALLLIFFSVNPFASAQFFVQTLKSFGVPHLSGASPLAPLTIDADGWLYGTTSAGGSNALGTVFKIRREGSNYIVLHAFTGADGRSPQAGLMLGSDGVLYGSTSAGGSNTTGTLFKLNRDGTAFSVLHHFSGPVSDWGSPRATLCQGADGLVYGTTFYGGSNNAGTVFKISTNGNSYAVLHHFTGPDGHAPSGRLLQGLNGALYGTTYQGGVSNVGTIFTLSTDGSGYTVLYNFKKTRTGSVYNGYNPAGGLVQGSDGVLYGTTVSGGGWFKNGTGTVFKIDPDGGGYTVLLSFNGTYMQGAGPRCELLLGSDGTLFGTAMGALSTGYAGSAFAVRTNGSSPRALHEFTISANDGSFPVGTLAQDPNGMLFGINSQGGLSGVGTIFGVLPNGTGFRTLHNFSPSGGDPKEPRGRLVQDNNGFIYGVTSTGGTNGCGTIFKINPDGSGYSTLRTYAGLDGRNPRGLMLNPDGLLYGTTFSGGISNCGTVFRTTMDGSFYSVLHSFDGLGGANPEAGVTLATNGVLYGTTYGGGTGYYGSSDGTIYRLNPDGTGFAKLRDFNHGNGPDGCYPRAGIVQGIDGILYGGTPSSWQWSGNVFRLNLDGGAFTLLHIFSDPSDDWAGLFSDLLQSSDQMFYGATEQGIIFRMNPDGSSFQELHSFEYSWPYQKSYLVFGSNDSIYGVNSSGGPNLAGTIFKISRDGTGYAMLHTFGAKSTDGANPAGPLLLGKDGLLYGTTSGGGAMGCGTVFRMVPLPQISSFERMASGVTRFSIDTVSNFTYRVETSTNLIDWTALTNLTAVGNQTTVSDSTWTNSLQRFYRASWVQ